MTKISFLFAAASLALVLTPAYGQFELNSTYRSVEARYFYDSGSSPFVFDIDVLWDASHAGTFTREASATNDTYASLMSFVGEAGIIKGSSIADRDTIVADEFTTEIANSSSMMQVEFSITAPTPYSLGLDAHASIYVFENDFVFRLASDSETIIDYDAYSSGWEFDPSGNWLDVSLDGVLQPGDYTLEVIAKSTGEFIGSSHYGGFPVEYDFTFSVPGPSGIAVLAMPALGMAPMRRRRTRCM